jgi:hypothetical protein
VPEGKEEREGKGETEEDTRTGKCKTVMLGQLPLSTDCLFVANISVTSLGNSVTVQLQPLPHALAAEGLSDQATTGRDRLASVPVPA